MHAWKAYQYAWMPWPDQRHTPATWHGRLVKNASVKVFCDHEHFGVEAPPMKKCGGFYDRNERT